MHCQKVFNGHIVQVQCGKLFGPYNAQVYCQKRFNAKIAHHFIEKERPLLKPSAGLHSKVPTANQCTFDQSKLGQWAYHCQLQGTTQQVLQMAHMALEPGRAALLEIGLPVGQFQAPQESSTGLLGLQWSQL